MPAEGSAPAGPPGAATWVEPGAFAETNPLEGADVAAAEDGRICLALHSRSVPGWRKIHLCISEARW